VIQDDLVQLMSNAKAFQYKVPQVRWLSRSSRLGPPAAPTHVFSVFS